MKKIVIVSLVLIFIVAMISAAFASGYNSPLWSTQAGSPPVNSKMMPHGGYADTTNRCKDCHAVHLASGSYKMLRNGATDGQTACQYCHGAGGIVGARNGVVLNTSGHGLGGAAGLIYAPDDSTPGYSIQAVQWGCAACHSVHNNNVVGNISERALTTSNTTNVLLKAKPDSNSPGVGAGSTVTLSQWCKECHGANYGTYGQGKTVAGPTTAYGHDAGATAGITRYAYGVGNTYAYVPQGVTGGFANAPRCNQCHAAGAAQRSDVGAVGWVTGQNTQVSLLGSGANGYEGYFPHSGYSTSYSLLKNSNKLTAGNSMVDDVCNDCHYTPSLP